MMQDNLKIVTEQTFINLPPWDGHPHECGTVWELHKGARVAVCHLWTHPSGGEARLTVDGEWHRGEAGRDGLALVELALDWKAQFETKGWAWVQTDILKILSTSGITTCVLLILGWFAKDALREWVAAGARHSYAVDLEQMKADLRSAGDAALGGTARGEPAAARFRALSLRASAPAKLAHWRAGWKRCKPSGMHCW